MPLDRRTGITMVILSALAFSTMGLFTKGVSAGAWEIIFWRGVAAVMFTMTYLAVRREIAAEVRALNWPAFWVVILGASGTAAFIPALKLTTIANVTMVYGAAPFVAAALSWLFLREWPTRRVAWASLAAFIGVGVVVWGGIATGGTKGDLLALWMTFMIAATMVIYRRYPHTTAALPAALQSVILLPCALYFGDPFAVDMAELPLMAGFGFMFAIASVALSEGARRLPSSEAALLSILELPIAPVLAFLVLAEVPSVQAIIGGAVIITAVAWTQRN